jgi:hypothetical protein
LGPRGGDYWEIEPERKTVSPSFSSSMQNLLLNGEADSVSVISLVTKCGLFQITEKLPSKPYKVESSISMCSLPEFARAVAEISDANARDRSQLGDPQIDPVIRRELDLVRAAPEQLFALGRSICALEEEMGRVREAIAEMRRSMGQQDSEWKAAIGDLHTKARRERNDVSRLKALLQNAEGKHEKLRETVARQGDDLTETRGQNLELGERLQQLEEENRLLRESSEGLKGQLARFEAGQESCNRDVQGLEEENRLLRESSTGVKRQMARVEARHQRAVARLQETMTAVESKVKEELSNVQGELAKMKEDIKCMKMTGTQYPPSITKSRIRVGP